MRAWKNRFCLVLSALFVFFLSGCSPIGIEALESGGTEISMETDADQVKEKAGEGAQWAVEKGKNIGEAVTAGVAGLWLSVCLHLRGWAPFVIVGSILVGYALAEFFPKNAEIKKFAVVTMCVRVPLVTLIITYLALFSYGAVAGRKTIYSEMAAKAALPCALWYEMVSPFGWAAAALCAASIVVGLVLAERFRRNPDVVRMAGRYLVVRVPTIVFLVFIFYPFLYVMLS